MSFCWRAYVYPFDYTRPAPCSWRGEERSEPVLYLCRGYTHANARHNGTLSFRIQPFWPMGFLITEETSQFLIYLFFLTFLDTWTIVVAMNINIKSRRWDSSMYITLHICFCS